jgi:xanthine dehydrogenase small subunit
VEAALPAFAVDYQPITDMRASKEYRLLVAQNLLRRFQLETSGSGERLSKAVA